MAINLDGFYDAGTAREIARGTRAGSNVILAEIQALQTGIDDRAAAGELLLTVTNSTTMTTDLDGVYFPAWNDPYDSSATTDADKAARKLARDKMDRVINYFTRLGYSIKRQREGTNNRFQWLVRW